MNKKSVLSFLLVASLVSFTIMPTYGATGPGLSASPAPEGMSQEKWEQLNDQVIDFNELPDLVRYFNPEVQNVTDKVNDSIGNAQYIHDELRRYISDLKDDADALKDSGATDSMQGMQQYIILKMTVKAMKTGAETLKRNLDLLNRPNSSANSNITLAAKSYTYYANQIMIGYNSAVANRTLMQKVLETSLAASEARALSYQVGMATEADLLAAQKDVLSAQSLLLKLDNTIDNLQHSLCLMTGYSVDNPPVIGELPVFDFEAISAIDLEADTAIAIGNNYNLITERHTDSNKSSTSIKNKDARVSEGEQNIAITMQSFYQSLLNSRNAYDTSCTAYEKAILEKRKADRANQLGMLSKINYLQAQMALLRAESEKQSAYISLYQAFDTYQWAVKGIIMNSGQ